eukprot:COSAG02_NODE_1542_length_12011_cov_103.068754_5_plen_38_part_00
MFSDRRIRKLKVPKNRSGAELGTTILVTLPVVRRYMY